MHIIPFVRVRSLLRVMLELGSVRLGILLSTAAFLLALQYGERRYVISIGRVA
jgi:hypothetical protein